MSDEQSSSTNETSAEQQTESLLTSATTGESGEANEQTGTVAEQQAEPQGAPESYEFNLPDGAQPGEMLESFSAMAKEDDLSQEKAQKYVDLYIKQQQETLKQWADVKKSWAEEVKADKELGGAKFAETMETCGRFLKEMELPADFLKLMDDYGIGNHPAFVKAIHKIALKTREDKPVIAGAGGTLTTEARIQNLYKS